MSSFDDDWFEKSRKERLVLTSKGTFIAFIIFALLFTALTTCATLLFI